MKARIAEVRAIKGWSAWWSLPEHLRSLGYYLVLREIYGMPAREALEHRRKLAELVGPDLNLIGAMKEALA